MEGTGDCTPMDEITSIATERTEMGTTKAGRASPRGKERKWTGQRGGGLGYQRSLRSTDARRGCFAHSSAHRALPIPAAGKGDLAHDRRRGENRHRQGRRGMSSESLRERRNSCLVRGLGAPITCARLTLFCISTLGRTEANFSPLGARPTSCSRSNNRASVLPS